MLRETDDDSREHSEQLNNGLDLQSDDENGVEDAELLYPETPVPVDASEEQQHEDEEETEQQSQKSFRFPMSRIKTIMKTVPTVHLINMDAVQLVEKAVELFVRDFSRDIHKFTVLDNKKTISRSHIDNTVRQVPIYEFLEGMLD